MKVSFFLSAPEGKPAGDWYISQILEAIKNGRWATLVNNIRTNLDQKKELKKLLPAFTPSGTFHTWRAEKNLVAHSALICIDFDELDMPEVLRNALTKNKYTYACFVSVSGKGVAWIVKINAKDKESHLDYFFALEKYVQLNFNVQIDKACKNLDRLRFVSYDPDLYLNPNSSPFNLDEVPKSVPTIRRKKKYKTGTQNEKKDNRLQNVLTKAQKDGLHYIEGQRHNYIVSTAGLANQLGVNLDDYLSFMTSLHGQSFDCDKAQKVYKLYVSQFNTKS